MKKIRISFDTTPKMKDIINSLSSRCGITQSEMLRRAISLLLVFEEAKDRGESMAFVKNEKLVSRLV